MEPIHLKILILQSVKNLTNYDILSHSEMGPGAEATLSDAVAPVRKQEVYLMAEVAIVKLFTGIGTEGGTYKKLTLFHCSNVEIIYFSTRGIRVDCFSFL